MEDEERQKKLEAGKAKLAEYRMRKAHADSQKKQKKKKKKKPSDDSEGDSQGRVEGELDQPGGGRGGGGGGGGEEEEVVSGGGRDGNKDPPTTEFTFTRTLRSGETVKHDQTYNIEPESEVSTTAEDYSSEEEVEHLQQVTKGGTMQDMEEALMTKTRAVEELSRELEEIRAAFGTEGIQQLQDFEAALKQRDGIITQLTSNLQQAREEKDEIMKEFLALTEQSQKLQIQFQQLQAGETLRNTSHSSTAADLLQARQQLVQYQQQLEEINVEVRAHQEMSGEQQEYIGKLQYKLNEVKLRMNEKDLVIAEQEKVILIREQSQTQLRTAEETFAQTLKEKNQFILEQTAIMAEHERSLNLLREKLAHVGRTTDENITQLSDEKDLIVKQQERIISERDASLMHLEDELKKSETCLCDLQRRMIANESELQKCLGELESTKSDLASSKGEAESCKLQLENEQKELESCRSELAASRQKERMSSNEIMQLMGTVEDLQKRCHQGSMSESDTIQKMQGDTVRKLEALRAELDEMYGQQIVQMKQELNLQHAARVQQMTEQRHAELELIKAQQLSQSSAASSVEVEGLNGKIRELQWTLEESQAMHDEARQQFGRVRQEKLGLQARVEHLLRDLRSAEEKAERVSLSLKSQESKKDEAQQLRESVEGLRVELTAAQDAAVEAESKHESETTNYKIKLEMLEREKDEVLDRMAESQEAELERLRTQLLFSHEEELTTLQEELQRDNFLNTENLLNEAATKHEKALHELRVGYEGELHLLQRERVNSATERDELLHQIVELKEDLNLALHSSKAEKLVEQLQELQIELEELRKGGEERARVEKENQMLQKQMKEKEHYWEEKHKEQEQEKETLVTSINTLEEELDSKRANMEKLSEEKNQIQQQVAELREELEKQKTTFSFAEKNFEVNYQELKEEYTCLVEAKTKLEAKMLKETLEFEAKLSSFQSQICELEESRDVAMEKESSKLMEKLNAALSETTSLAGRLSEVTEQLRFTESKVGKLEEELMNARREKAKVTSHKESQGKKLGNKQEIRSQPSRGQSAQTEARLQRGEPSEDHHLQIQSLQEEIKKLQCLLRGAEGERDAIRQTLDLQRLSQTPPPPPAAVRSSGEGPVEGRSSPLKPTASGSGRRKRRQRSKQERRAGSALSDGREERQREEEEEAAVVEERAKSAAEQEEEEEEEMQAQMESQVKSRSQAGAGTEDSADGDQGDGGSGSINKGAECRLQMEAQRLSLSQINAAQLELLQEEEADPQTLKERQRDQDEQKVFRYHSVIQTVSEECSRIILSFRKVFGEEFLESVAPESRSLVPEETPTAHESTSAVLEARELYRDLQRMRDGIEQEHRRLSQLQSLLREDGNKVTELQAALDELRRTSERQISDLRLQLSASTRDGDEPAGASFSSSSSSSSSFFSSTSSAVELQRLKEEAREKQQHLEEFHRQEMERLRAHFQQEATESEERYATELFMLQQRRQEVTQGDPSKDSLSSSAQSGSEMLDEHIGDLKELREVQLSDGGVEQRGSAWSAGLTAQLQALRRALYNKYLQEVAALKEQHSSELRGLREAIRGGGGGGFTESRWVTGHLPAGDKKHQEQVEEEVAKVIVQMSVEFAQQTELARINKRVCQASTSMQTHLDQGDPEEAETEELTPRASVSSWLERELEERDVEIRKLKEALQRTEPGPGPGPEPVLKRSDHGEEEQEEEQEEAGDVQEGTSQAARSKVASQHDGGSPDKETERTVLHEANVRLREVLVEVLKTTAAAEETMGLHMQSLRDASTEAESQKESATRRGNSEPIRPPAAGFCTGGLWSVQVGPDQGLEVMMDRLLHGAGPRPEDEEHLMGVSGRLQSALEKMLMAISDATNQLEHARITQTELMRESFRHNQEMNGLLQKQEELQERLSEEARAREQLALELHRAEGLIDGYTGERTALEEQLRHKEELQLSLEQELQVTGSRLHELEQERIQMQEERELLSRQQEAMREDAGPRELRLVEAAMVAAPEADLLEETEKLMKEKVEVQRQAEKENTELLQQVKLLEAELEEQVNRVIELEQVQSTESGDLRQQIQALEKQLEKNRRFLDEQAVDREHERDFFQQEIQKLEEQLKNPQKLQAGSEERNRQVDQLTSQLKEKADWCSELLLSSEQLRRELGERDEEIDKLESRIRELEQALLASADSLEKVEQKKQHASVTEARQSTLEAQLQTEREALERKEKEICNLEEQLEQFKEELENKGEEVQQLHMQLEIQRKEISSQQQYLETRDAMIQVMEEKDRQIALLNEQITKRQHTETTSDNKELDDRDELFKDLESQVECLKGEQERLKRNNEEELDQLNAVIDKLQQELANIEQKQAAEEDEEARGASESGVGKEEYDEMKQRMDLVTTELDTLKTEHSELLETCQRLKGGAGTEGSEGELEEALREKTAGLVVMQAQVQALEQSAATRVEQLDVRIQELEDLADEKDSEIGRCRLQVEKTQSYADGLLQRVSKLEENLRERVAAALVSQATLEAFQHRPQPAGPKQDSQRPADPHGFEFGDLGIPQLDLGGLAHARQAPAGRVVRLTQKLRELEVGLSGMQKDQELQKQLLSSSEEEVLEYERRLAVLMDLLRQMKTRTQQRTPAQEEEEEEEQEEKETSSDELPTSSQLRRQLQVVRDEASATKLQLDGFQTACGRLEEELQEKTAAVERLREQLQEVASSEGEEVKTSELRRELMETRDEAAASKEELSSCKESLEKLQELLQEREMTIAQLKAELFQVKADEDGADSSELLQQQLEKVQNDAASTKEELCSYKEQNERLQEDLRLGQVSLSEVRQELEEMRLSVGNTKEELSSFRLTNQKLQEELRARELAVSKLKEELVEARAAVMKAAESGPPPPPSPSPSPSPQPPSSSTTQPKRKGGKQPAGKGNAAKDKSALSRKNSSTSSQSSNKPHSPRPSSSSEQQRQHATAAAAAMTVTSTDSSTQTDLGRESTSAAKEEVEEVIGEFQEKIVQMQELHAAEILDMEARHISESENLRRDTQALEDECKALKAVIEKLRSAEVPTSRQERLPSQFKDGYTSDSSSDYSQRTGYDLPSLQPEFRTTPEGARRENEEQLPDRIKTLLREVHQEGMQVLSLSELPVSEGEAGGHLHLQGWAKERDALLATVESLKNLVTQKHRETPASSGGADWREQLLEAVRQVFLRERGALKSALYSQLDLLDTSDAVVHLNQLERRLAEQDAQHREAMSSLHAAERSSLISELRHLRGQLQQLHQGVQPALSLAGECSMKEQREGGGAGGGGGGGGGAAEVDGLLVEELKGELLQTKLELETTLKAQHNHLKELDALRVEVSQKAAEVDALTDQLTEEKKRSRELQWTVEKEKCRTGRTEESNREELEDLQLSLEEQKSRVAQLTQTLDQDQQTSSRLSQQSEQERLSLHRQLQELQVQLQTERAKAREVSAALGRERELRAGVSSGGGEQPQEGAPGGLLEEQALLERLQKELDDKHAQVVDLLGQVEAQRLEVVRRDEELTLAGQRSRREQEALLEARGQLEALQVQTLEVQEQLEAELERGRSLEEEKERLEERLQRSGEPKEASGAPNAAWRGESTDRTTDWVFQQKSSGAPPRGETSPGVGAGPGALSGGLHHGPWRTVDQIVAKLHLISSKVRGMASKRSGSSPAQVDGEDLSWLQSSVEEVITMLQQSPGLPPVPESAPLLAGGSSNTLTERLLRQNAELTGFVSRLTEEKNDLRNHTLRLEEELRRHRKAGQGSGSGDGLSRRGASKSDSAGLLLSQEREAWTQERLRLEKALHLAQSQTARLRGEMRADNLREITGPEADNAALKRMYGKYLRSESFRKALIYQKKYLLLLLGGFQECEEATLSLLSRMGGRPSLSGDDSFSHRRRGLMRFRSAVRVSIALSRMRFLVKRWHKATGMSSPTSCTVNKNGTAQISGTEEARDSPYLHPGSVEMYRDRGGGLAGVSSRGRSGRESPRSAMSCTQHRYHMSGDHGGLTCSHLQTYDPDRALTDYISRLEALQRRLGSVTSGASSYAQLHFGLRR